MLWTQLSSSPSPKMFRNSRSTKRHSHAVKPASDFDQKMDATLKIALIPCRNLQGNLYRYRTKGHHSQIDHKSVHQYNHVVKTLKEGNSPRLSQRGHFREFINIKRKVTDVSLINGYRTNDPPCSLNIDHGPIGC